MEKNANYSLHETFVVRANFTYPLVEHDRSKFFTADGFRGWSAWNSLYVGSPWRKSSFCFSNS